MYEEDKVPVGILECGERHCQEPGEGEKNELFRPLKKFELSSAARKRYRSMCVLDKGNPDLPEIRRSLCNKNRTAKS